jgi:hypothetical protein
MKPFIIIQKNSVFVNRDGREGNRDGSRFQQPLDKLGCEVGSSTFVIPALGRNDGEKDLIDGPSKVQGKDRERGSVVNTIAEQGTF